MNQEIKNAYIQNREDIATLVRWLQNEFAQEPNEKTTWSTVANLMRTRENLIDMVAFVSEKPFDEIEARLEMHEA